MQFVHFFLVLFLSSLVAQVEAKAIVSLQIENDTYLGQDQHYSNGLNFSYLPLDKTYPKLSTWLNKQGFKHQEEDLFIELALTNAIYTPEDIENPEPQPNDHPWAGHTYVGAKLSHRPLSLNANWQYQQRVEINLGIIGPAAGARVIQTEFHKIIDSHDPKGWHNQLKNEPTVNLFYSWQGQQATSLNSQVFVLSQPEVGLALGSPFTYINYGWGLGLSNQPIAVNLPAIQPTSLGSNYFLVSKSLTWQALVGVQQRLVIYNQFLDGQVFHSGPSLHKRRLVNQAYLGVGFSYSKWRLTSKLVHTGREFSGQKHSNNYATLGVSYWL